MSCGGTTRPSSCWSAPRRRRRRPPESWLEPGLFMPELPDVERLRGTIDREAAGATISAIPRVDALVLRNVTGRGLRRALEGARIHGVRRAGKRLVVLLA